MSRPKFLLRDQAEREMDEIARYIALRNLGAGLGFYDAVERDVNKLAEYPRMGTLRKVRNSKLRGLRSWPISGYGNYLIFYLPLGDGRIEVLHIIHGARDFGGIIEKA